METVVPTSIAAFLNLFAPVIVKIVIKKAKTEEMRYMIATCLSLLSGIIIAIVSGSKNFVEILSVSVFASQTAYRLYWKKLIKGEGNNGKDTSGSELPKGNN